MLIQKQLLSRHIFIRLGLAFFALCPALIRLKVVFARLQNKFFPEEGKYHFDGHRLCGIVFSPEESAKHKNICPKCNKALTIGVLNRVEKLADRGEIKTEFKNNMHHYENRIPFYNLIPLDEVIAKSLKMSGTSRKVKEEYEKLIKQFGGE